VCVLGFVRCFCRYYHRIYHIHTRKIRSPPIPIFVRNTRKTVLIETFLADITQPRRYLPFRLPNRPPVSTVFHDSRRQSRAPKIRPFAADILVGILPRRSIRRSTERFKRLIPHAPCPLKRSRRFSLFCVERNVFTIHFAATMVVARYTYVRRKKFRTISSKGFRPTGLVHIYDTQCARLVENRESVRRLRVTNEKTKKRETYRVRKSR